MLNFLFVSLGIIILCTGLSYYKTTPTLTDFWLVYANLVVLYVLLLVQRFV